MKFKGFFLVSIILLTILTGCAVSASDEISDINLTVSETFDDAIETSSNEDVDEISQDESETGDVLDRDNDKDKLMVSSFKNIESFEKGVFHGEISKECTPEFYFNLYSSEMKNGNVLIFFDDNLIFNETFDPLINYDNEPDFPACAVQLISLSKLKSLDYKDYLVSVKYAENNNELLIHQTQVSRSYTFGFEVGVLDEDALGFTDEMDVVSMEDDYQYAIWGSDFNFKVILPNNHRGNLTVVYNGKILNYIKSYTDAYYFNIAASDLKFGKNQLSAKYSGDDKYPEKTIYLDFETLPSFTIPKNAVEDNKCIVSINLTKSARGNFNVYSVVTDGFKLNKTNLIKSQKVSNGVSSIEVPLTDDENYFYLEYTDDDYSWGSFYIVEAEYDFTPFELDVSYKNEILINDSSNYFIVDLSKKVSGKLSLYIDGFFIKDKKITSYTHYFLMNSPEYNLTLGKHNFEIRYSGVDSDSVSFNGTFSIISPSDNQNKVSPVKKADKITLTLKKITVKKSAKKLVLKATLKINGKVAKGKIIIFKFNKKTYKATTNKKGVAKIIIKKSVLKKLKVGKKVKYQATYSKNTVKKTVKVK